MRTAQREFAFFSLLPAIALLLFLAGCGGGANAKTATEPQVPKSHTYYTLDTVVTLRVYDDRMTDKHFDDVNDILERIDREMNRQRETSELAEVNRQSGKSSVQVSEETMQVIRTAMHYASLSEGRFDPSIGAIVDLWGIGQEGAAVPEKELIDEKLELVDYHNIVIDEPNRTVLLKKAGMILDLGGIAKGYAADAIAEYLRRQDFNSALIDLGGNIMALGHKSDGIEWNIGVQEPNEQRGLQIGSLKVSNKSVVTSGVYERFFEEDGLLYHHILNTTTGFPTQNELLSATIITELSIDADALSTTAFAMGPEEGKRFIESLGYAEAIFVTEDRDVILTSGLSDRFKLTNHNFRLAD